MQTKSAWREALTFVAFLAIIGLITGLIIITYRENLPTVQGPQSTVLGANAAYPATPDPEARQTAAALFTQNVIEQTKSALFFQSDDYHKTAYLEGTPIPTGTDTGFIVLDTSRHYNHTDPKNTWFGLIHGHTVRVDAGASLEDPQQGVIYLMMVLMDGTGIMDQIRTPGKDGAVLIASELNNRLVLVAEDGTVFYFDLPALRFVNSLTEWVPTPTSTPTVPPPTPYPPPPPSPTRPYPLPITATFEPYVPYPTPGQ